MVLVAVWIVVLAGKINKLEHVPGKWFAAAGLGFILSAAVAVGVTMYAMSEQPQWWDRGNLPFASIVIVGIVVALCFLSAMWLVGKEARR
jgi:multisubunit Na+/H+ antiporter MnhB subunit